MFSPAAIRRVVKLMKCLREFGMLLGMWIYLRLIFNKRGVRLQLPGYRAPIFLRPEIGDITVFDKIFIQREYDLPPSIDAGSPQVIVDAGANIGCSAVFFAQQYPQAKIIAIEPEEGNFQMLRKNTAAYPQIIPVQAALWSRPAYLTFENLDYGTMAFQVREADTPAAGSIKALAMPEVLRLAEADHVDLLKLDIECAEQELFSHGDRSWLNRAGIIVIELHDWIRGGNSMAFYAALACYQFRQFQSGENIIIVNEGLRAPLPLVETVE